MKTINIIKSFILTIAIFSSQFANSQQVKWNKKTKKFDFKYLITLEVF